SRFWRLWELWVHIDTAGGLPSWFDWGRRAVTALLAGTWLGGWAARATHWPLPIIVLIGIAAAGCVLFVWNQVAWRKYQQAFIKGTSKRVNQEADPVSETSRK